jgi:hypothetical protein
VAADTPFRFVQFEFGFPLGPEDGRYLRRSRAGDGEPQWVIVLKTLGAPQRRLFKGRKPAAVDEAAAATAVPTARATLIGAAPFGSVEEAERWLEALRRGEEELDAAVDEALAELNAVLRVHRAAAADPYVREVSRAIANIVRVGYGSGDQVADGQFSAAYELPDPAGSRGRRVSSEALAPLERLAAVLGGSSDVRVGEELVLRARLDVEAGRWREAALQARIALEALLAELGDSPGDDIGALESYRQAVGQAANAALAGELPAELVAAVDDAVKEMRRALRRVSGG